MLRTALNRVGLPTGAAMRSVRFSSQAEISPPLGGVTKTPGSVELPSYVTAKFQTKDAFNSPARFEKELRSAPGDIYKKRVFHYMVTTPIWATGAYIGRNILTTLASVWGPSGEQSALAAIEVDVTDVTVGKTILIFWQGKPVFIRHRNEKEIAREQETPMNELRDPQTDQKRCPTEEWAIFEAICTHLGCIPVADQGLWEAFFCPCHGSHYDSAGRIRKGPAPLNLKLVPFKFLDEATLFIGE